MIERLEHDHAGGNVERAGWLVAKQDVGPLGNRPCDGNALLFAAGQLRGKVIQPMLESHELQRLLGCHGRIGNLRDQRDVLACGQAGNEVVELEDEPDVMTTVVGERRVAGGGQVAVLVDDPPRRRHVETAEDVEQGGLAAARGAEQHHELRCVDVEVDTAERFDCDFAHVLDLGHAARDEHHRGSARIGASVN